MRGLLFLEEAGPEVALAASPHWIFELPLYDQPALHYCIANLVDWGASQILLIGGASSLEAARRLLGDGSRYGELLLEYQICERPTALVECLTKCGQGHKGQPICIMLAHNFFFGPGLPKGCEDIFGGGRIFAHPANREHYARLEFSSEVGNSSWRVVDMAIYEAGVTDFAASLTSTGNASQDLELLHRAYADRGLLEVVRLGGEVSWFDVRCLDSLWDAARAVEEVEVRTGSKVCCLEELALECGLMTGDQYLRRLEKMSPCRYRDYLARSAVQYGLLPPQAGPSIGLVEKPNQGAP